MVCRAYTGVSRLRESGTTLEELKKNLLEIYNDIKEGLVPDAKPSKVLELVV